MLKWLRGWWRGEEESPEAIENAKLQAVYHVLLPNQALKVDEIAKLLEYYYPQYPMPHGEIINNLIWLFDNAYIDMKWLPGQIWPNSFIRLETEFEVVAKMR